MARSAAAFAPRSAIFSNKRRICSSVKSINFSFCAHYKLSRANGAWGSNFMQIYPALRDRSLMFEIKTGQPQPGSRPKTLIQAKRQLIKP
jgi:hypothetical protein